MPKRLLLWHLKRKAVIPFSFLQLLIPFLKKLLLQRFHNSDCVVYRIAFPVRRLAVYVCVFGKTGYFGFRCI